MTEVQAYLPCDSVWYDWYSGERVGDETQRRPQQGSAQPPTLAESNGIFADSDYTEDDNFRDAEEENTEDVATGDFILTTKNNLNNDKESHVLDGSYLKREQELGNYASETLSAVSIVKSNTDAIRTKRNGPLDVSTSDVSPTDDITSDVISSSDGSSGDDNTFDVTNFNSTTVQRQLQVNSTTGVGSSVPGSTGCYYTTLAAPLDRVPLLVRGGAVLPIQVPHATTTAT